MELDEMFTSAEGGEDKTQRALPQETTDNVSPSLARHEGSIKESSSEVVDEEVKPLNFSSEILQADKVTCSHMSAPVTSMESSLSKDISNKVVASSDQSEETMVTPGGDGYQHDNAIRETSMRVGSSVTSLPDPGKEGSRKPIAYGRGVTQDAEEKALDYSMEALGAGRVPEKRKSRDGDLADEVARKAPKLEEDAAGQSSQVGDATKKAKDGREQPKNNKRQRPSSMLREGDVGISTYIGDHKGFTGIIKERYEDFVVHEIDEKNQVIHLTDFTCPIEGKPKAEDVSDALSDHDKKTLDQLQTSTDEGSHHLIEVTSASKESRTKIHQAIRQNFSNLDSNTVDEMNKKYIKVVQKTANSRTPSRWPKDRPKYCRFVLSKENIDTNEVLALMAKYLRTRPHAFQYAGTKDKRAVTVQEMTIQKCEANRLAKLNQQLRGVRLGNFRYVDRQLNLGELSGNHFEIVLRDVVGSQPEMEKALISLKEKGFINYFGMQRFGNTSVPTHHIGRAVLKNQWEEAINLILLPRPGDDSEWRRHWMETKDAKSTLEKMPFNKRLSLEQQVLKSLTLTGNNFCQAFASIPRNARMLYLHSYQSMVWNSVASKRIPKWGVFVNTGDLVAKKSINNDNTSWICPEKVEDETLHKYSFDDIVLPLPGHSVHYPDNEAKTYIETLAQDGLTMDHLKHKIKDYSLPGAYRKLVVKPSNVSWSFMKYDDVTKKLIQSDLDRMEGIPEPVPEEDGSKLALRLSFSLPTSAYATMALRELLRTETSASHHAAMTLQSRCNEQAVADA